MHSYIVLQTNYMKDLYTYVYPPTNFRLSVETCYYIILMVILHACVLHP